jgi:hypothetical protein
VGVLCENPAVSASVQSSALAALDSDADRLSSSCSVSHVSGIKTPSHSGLAAVLGSWRCILLIAE